MMRLGTLAVLLLSVLFAPPAWALTYVPYALGGTPLCDPFNDQSPAYTDIACNSTDSASAYFASDGTTLGFAFVLAVDPRTATQQAPLLSTAYVVELFVGATQVATVGVDGKLTAGQDFVYAKCVGSPAVYLELVDGAVAGGRLSVTAEPGPEGYFRLAFEIPLAALASCGITGTTSVQLDFGTSQAANLDVINKDELGSGDPLMPGDPTLAPKLAVTKVEATDPVVAGDELVFVLGFQNTGSADATGVVLTDVIPANTTFVAATGGGVYDPGTNTVTWSLGTVPVGGTGSVALRVLVGPTTPEGTVIQNTVVATATNADSATATSSTRVTSLALLTFWKSGDPNPVAAGGQIAYTLMFGNTGFSTAAGVTIIDPLPANTTFVSASNGGVYDPFTNTVAWNLGPLDPGATASVTLTVLVQAGLPEQTLIINTATLDATNADPVDASSTNIVIGVPALELFKTATPEPAKAGEVVTYTLAYKNSGTAVATGVQLTDIIPPNTTFLAASGGGTFDALSGAVTWTLGDLAAGASGAVTLQVTVASPLPNGTLLENSANLTSSNAPFASALAITTVTSAPVIDIVKSGPATRVNAGDTITYTIAIANTGTDAATSVVLVDSISIYTGFVSASDGGLFDPATHKVTWSIGSLPATATRTVTLVVRVNNPLPRITAIVNAATVTTAQTDPQTATFTNLVVVAQTVPVMTMDFRFGVKGRADDIAVAAFEVRTGPGQPIDATAHDVVVEIANVQCGGTLSRITLPAGTLKSTGTTGTAYFAGYVTDGVTGKKLYVNARVVTIATGYRITLNYKYANFICLEGTTHRSVRYTITIGDAFMQADMCFQRLTIGTLYWPPRIPITCP